MIYYAPPGPPTFQIDPPEDQIPRTAGEARKLTVSPGGLLRVNLDGYGREEAGDALDQGVVLSIAVQKGSIPSAVKVGNDLHKVELGTDRTASEVETAVLNSYPLSDYLERRLVSLEGITHEVSSHGRLLVAVTYRKAGASETSTASNG